MSTATKRLSIADYDRMIAGGRFDGDPRPRVELIAGVITPMSPIGPPHDETVNLLLEWTVKHFTGQPMRLRVQQPIDLPRQHTAPQPDIAWVRQQSYFKKRPQADEVLLVVEVADSSLLFDLNDKARLYARANIADYWVVNLPQVQIDVFRQPRAGKFREHLVISHPGKIAPLALPSAELTTSFLFGPLSGPTVSKSRP